MRFDFWAVALTLQPLSLKKVGLKAIILFFWVGVVWCAVVAGAGLSAYWLCYWFY